MALSGPAGPVDSAQSEPSGAAAIALAAPGIEAQFSPCIALSDVIGVRIALEGKIAVFAIGAAGIDPGETERGVTR